MADKLAGWFAFSVNLTCGLAAMMVAWKFRPFAAPPRGAEAWSWLAHGVVVGWCASAAISLFWGGKWLLQALGYGEVAWLISRYGGYYDAVWRSTLLWAAMAHLYASRAVVRR
jgi:hypothetical protein